MKKLLASVIVAVFLVPAPSLTLSNRAWAKPPQESSAHPDKRHDKKKHGKLQGEHQKKKPHKIKMEHKVNRDLHELLKHKKELNLTKEQIDQIETIKLNFDRQKIRAKADIQVSDLELSFLLKDQTTPMVDLETKVREAEQLKGTLRINAIKAQRQALQVLTPEQRERKKNLHKKMAGINRPQSHGKAQVDELRVLAKEQEKTYGPH